MATTEKRFAPPNPYEERRTDLNNRAAAAGLSKAEIARRIGYFDQSRTNYVRNVMTGVDVSKPMLDKVEAVIEEEEKVQAAA